MSQELKSAFNKKNFLNDLIKDLEIKNLTNEQREEIKSILEDRLDRYLEDTLLECLGTAQVRQLDFLQKEFPETEMPILLLILSTTFPDLQKKIREKTEFLKKEVMYLVKKVKELDKNEQL